MADDTKPLAGPVAFLLLARMWSRAAWQYRVSLVLTTVTQALAASLDLAALLVVYSQVHTLAGFTMPETLYLYGTTRLAFSLSDIVASGVETLSDSIRLGTFDVYLIRPVATLPQVLAEQFSPKRFGKVLSAAGTLAWAIATLPVHWTAPKILVCVGTVCCGFLIYCSVWVITGTISFFAVDARESANAFTYGAETLTEYPFSVYSHPLAIGLTFALPLAFITWQPSLYVLGHADPLGLPGFLRFAAPAVAAAMLLLAAAAWRFAIRHYRSTGS
ncbi:MAG TPA: ABC-2 family transporter protein [Actinocrinis sp.]|nr:ABC-2 family transporter protein [Actinocrinis sp.]